MPHRQFSSQKRFLAEFYMFSIQKKYIMHIKTKEKYREIPEGHAFYQARKKLLRNYWYRPSQLYVLQSFEVSNNV